MAHRVDTDLHVQRFGFSSDDTGTRLQFPRIECKRVEGRTDAAGYGITDAIFDGLAGRLDLVNWSAEAASLGGAWMRADDERFSMSMERIELSRGVRLTRAASGVEIIAPHVTLSEMKLTINGPFGRGASEVITPVPAAERRLRQDRLHFLDSLAGRINLTVKVVLDLPVLKRRTLDQQLRIAITEGTLDFRALDDSLDWLEGAFLDFTQDKDRLKLQWKVPIVGSGRDLISWRLDPAATTLAAFGRVPVRSLADFGFPGDGSPARPDDKRKTLQSLTLEGLDLALSLLAPRSLEVGHGLILFGGEDSPGMVDLKVTGSLDDRGPGRLTGAIGTIDTTIKDLRLGPVSMTSDRLHFDGLDELEVTFDGFSPTKITCVIHRVTATNLALHIGGAPQP